MFDVRLRTLLGAAPGEASYAQFLSLIDNPNAQEGPDLDFKGEQYRKGSEAAGELAKDVAALANAAGGTLILGLREDRATSIPAHANPEPLTDRLRKSYRETLILRLDPPVDCDIHFIAENPAAAALVGLVVISVPPSARGPHAVVGTTDLRDGTLRFPYRNDNHTAHMNLTQIKRAITAATSLVSAREEVLAAAHEDVAKDGRFLPGPRITLTVTPDLPGAFPVDKKSYGEVRGELADVELPLHGHKVFQSFGVGPRRFIASAGESRSRHVAHFHHDGTAAWVTEGPVVSAFPYSGSTHELCMSWHSDFIVLKTLVMMQHLVHHAVNRAGASGTATMLMGLVGGPPACGLASDRGGGVFEVVSPLEKYSAGGRAGLLLNAAEGGSALVQGAAVLLADCYQHFGVVEAEQLTLDGQINLGAWGPRSRDAVAAWAEGVGVEVLDT
ncbi:ATP-binding protein [Streptomyces sp. NPDC047315]|uniref:AlbA family DNA-binding domain-containing protein n=1 Tax=Streptomyces sp. NPDC047315 TaxID=3155142 RepID=UPI0033E7F48C